MAIKPRLLKNFISQSIRTDLCGVYATTMFLSGITGKNIKRSKSHELFGVSDGESYPGASHDDISKIVNRVAPSIKARWSTFRIAGSGPPSAAIKARTGSLVLPTVMTFGAKLIGNPKTCIHAILLVKVGGVILYGLDPLGEHPESTRNWNIKMVLGEAHISSPGTAPKYSVDWKHEVNFLTWEREGGRS